jgi:hypothetical protein
MNDDVRGTRGRPVDPYRDWDAAYVIGALSSEERREYEGHLAGCDECSAAVADLAGIPGLLASVDAESVDTISAATGPKANLGGVAGRMPADLLPRLLQSAVRERRRSRRVVAGALVVVAAAAASVALVLPGMLGDGALSPSAPIAASPTPTDAVLGEPVRMRQVVPSPLSADFTVAGERWGSRIETNCRYARPDAVSSEYRGAGQRAYALYVTDRSGAPTVVATWSAAPGASVEAVGTTLLTPQEIASVDIRSVETGQVLLASTLPR